VDHICSETIKINEWKKNVSKYISK
jgi:hypothetical protein